MKEFKSFYKVVGGNEGGKCKYPARLDTYGCGCQHDCRYCYAKSLLSFRGLWDADEPAVADIAKIKRKIKKLAREGVKVVRLGGMTDCLQPIERRCSVTYRTIKTLNEYGIHYLIVTKSAMIGEERYMKVMDKNLAHIQVTVTTLSDDLYREMAYEFASLPSKRIEAIEKLDAAGFDVALRLSPYIPEFVDVDELKKVNVKKLQVEFLRVNGWVQKWFDIDYSGYTVKQSGYRHLPLETKKELIERLNGGAYTISVCEDNDEAYDYWCNHFNPNPGDCCNLRM